AGRDQPVLGISMETLVALTVATASMPGSRLSSSAASRLSSDTTRYGPAWISTPAITGSRATRGTTPSNPVPAEWATPVPAPAREPVARRVGHHRPALGVVGRLGQVLGQSRERRSVHGPPSGGVGGRFDPAAVGPAAQGVIADAQQAGGLLDPEHRHPATVTQMRLQPANGSRFYAS